MSPRVQRPGPDEEVHIQYKGKTYRGRYSVAGSVVTVTWSLQSRSTQIGGSAPAVLARMLLKELIRDQGF
jgi:hypothetical protein